ncbi:MAG: NrsF family protein [Polyangiaceae bacterium]
MMPLPPGLKNRILVAVEEEPSATRQEALIQTAITAIAGTVAALGLFFLLGGFHRGSRPVPFVVATAAGSALVAVVAAWGAFGRGHSMLGRSRHLLLAITIATPLVLFAWIALWNVVYPETQAVWPGRIGLRCLVLSLAMTAWPLAVLTRLRREKNPTHPGLTGAARGSAIGSLAWVLVDLWCPIANPAHIVLGHALPLVILSMYGAWIGSRMMGVRAR